jgi:hypothetical protein
MPPETQKESHNSFGDPVPVILPGHVCKSNSLIKIKKQSMKAQESDSAYQRRRKRGITIIMIIEVMIFAAVMIYTH